MVECLFFHIANLNGLLIGYIQAKKCMKISTALPNVVLENTNDANDTNAVLAI